MLKWKKIMKNYKIFTYLKQFFIAVVTVTTITSLSILFSTSLMAFLSLSYDPFIELNQGFMELLNNYTLLKAIVLMIVAISFGAVVAHNLNKNN